MKRAGIAAASAALLLCAAACARGDAERLSVGLPRLPSAGLFYVAMGSGAFEARGLRVEERSFSSGRDALQALLRGEVDVAIVYATPLLRAAPHAPVVEVLTTLHTSSHNTRLVARADRGIRTVADLARKRIGVPRGTNAELFLETLLAFEGVPLQSVEIVDLPPGRSVEALAAGEVDAVAIWSPNADRAARALGAGARQLVSDVYTEVSMVVTRADVRVHRRGALVRLLHGLADAERMVLERPDDAAALVARAFAEEGEAAAGAQWARITPELGISHLLASVLRREDEWLRRTGGLEGPPLDLARLLEPGPLEEVAYELVTYSPAREAAP